MKAARIIVTKCHERAAPSRSAWSIVLSALSPNYMGRLPFAAERRQQISHEIQGASQDARPAASSDLSAFFPAGSPGANCRASLGLFRFAEKLFFHFFRNPVYVSPSCFRRRGVSRPSRDVGGGMRWAQGIAAWPMVARTNGSLRTAKSCGPDTPTLVSSARRASALSRHGGQQARRTRETTYKPFQPLRRGGRAFSARPVVPAACIFFAGGPRARPAPGLPCALHLIRGRT